MADWVELISEFIGRIELYIDGEGIARVNPLRNCSNYELRLLTRFIHDFVKNSIHDGYNYCYEQGMDGHVEADEVSSMKPMLGKKGSAA